MSDPATKAEYDAKFFANTRVEGFGFETATVAPCPGCAEPDWQRWPILGVEEAMAKGATCKHCGRGFRAIITKTHGGAGTSFTIVQTCGPDLPSYLPEIERA